YVSKVNGSSPAIRQPVPFSEIQTNIYAARPALIAIGASAPLARLHFSSTRVGLTAYSIRHNAQRWKDSIVLRFAPTSTENAYSRRFWLSTWQHEHCIKHPAMFRNRGFKVPERVLRRQKIGRS